MSGKVIFEGLFKVAIVVCLIVIITIQMQSGHSIVYVDTVKLLKGYRGMNDAQKEYKEKIETWNANLDSLKTELESRISEYETKRVGLSEKEKMESEKMIQIKQQEFANYQQVISEKIHKEDVELSAKVVSKVKDYVKKYGTEHGYEIIMAATQYGNILYSKDDRDITAQVLEDLNKAYN